jgi:hypothetical protein
MKYDEIKNIKEEKFRSSWTLKRHAFEKMIEVLEKEEKIKKAKGRRKKTSFPRRIVC